MRWILHCTLLWNTEFLFGKSIRLNNLIYQLTLVAIVIWLNHLLRLNLLFWNFNFSLIIVGYCLLTNDFCRLDFAIKESERIARTPTLDHFQAYARCLLLERIGDYLLFRHCRVSLFTFNTVENTFFARQCNVPYCVVPVI